MAECRVVVGDPSGLHAREAARLVRLAGRYACQVTVRHAGREADARSLLGILGLGVGPGGEIELAAEGPDAASALDALREALGGPHGEVDG